MTDRLSDEQVAQWTAFYPHEDHESLIYPYSHALALAREVQEWRAKAAADTVQDNPYKFTVRVSQTPTRRAWAVRIYEGEGSMQLMGLHDSEAEAREHARLIVAALKAVTVE